MNDQRSALIVDDERDIRELLVLTLGRMAKGTEYKGYDRLVEIKSKFDPENLFRVNQNLRPAVTTV